MRDQPTPIGPGAHGDGPPRRRLRRFEVRGPHCPLCGGPLVSGEGASLCAICGHRASGPAPYPQPGDRPAA